MIDIYKFFCFICSYFFFFVDFRYDFLIVCVIFMESVFGKVIVDDDRECDDIFYDIIFVFMYLYYFFFNKIDSF